MIFVDILPTSQAPHPFYHYSPCLPSLLVARPVLILKEIHLSHSLSSHQSKINYLGPILLPPSFLSNVHYSLWSINVLTFICFLNMTFPFHFKSHESDRSQLETLACAQQVLSEWIRNMLTNNLSFMLNIDKLKFCAFQKLSESFLGATFIKCTVKQALVISVYLWCARLDLWRLQIASNFNFILRDTIW